eukprot:101469_1
MMYLERIFSQSIFDCHFYNGLAQNSMSHKNVMSAAVQLLNARIYNHKLQCPNNIITLFNHWCDAQTVLNFEVMFWEKHKMSKDLQNIVFCETTNNVKIQQLTNKVFPNLVSYRYYDIDGA